MLQTLESASPGRFRLLDAREEVLEKVFIYLSDNDADLTIAATLSRKNCLFGMVDGFLDVETVEVDLIGAGIKVIF